MIKPEVVKGRKYGKIGLKNLINSWQNLEIRLHQSYPVVEENRLYYYEDRRCNFDMFRALFSFLECHSLTHP